MAHARPHAPTCAHTRPHALASARFVPLVPVFSRSFPFYPVFSRSIPFFPARSRFSFFSHNHPEVPTSAHMFHPFHFCCTCACGLLLGLWALLLGLGLWALARARALLRGWAGLVDGWARRSCGLVGAFPGLRVLVGAFAGLVLGACGLAILWALGLLLGLWALVSAFAIAEPVGACWACARFCWACRRFWRSASAYGRLWALLLGLWWAFAGLVGACGLFGRFCWAFW